MRKNIEKISFLNQFTKTGLIVLGAGLIAIIVFFIAAVYLVLRFIQWK